ncbi:MAG: STAS domain-containing protein [Bdellovibrionaceae bacterium]|nr:STAS domain-containing protein [Pseudobdellovibrionaceae bacterium]
MLKELERNWGMSFSLKVSEFSEWTILHLDGLFNAFNERQLLEALAPYRSLSKVGLDLSATESINLRVLQEIYRWSEDSRKNGGDFVLIAPTDSVRRAIEVFVGLHRMNHVRSLAELSLRDFYRRPAGLYEGPAPL